MNTVDIFHTLAAEADYVLLLFHPVEVMMGHRTDVRVAHSPGTQNTVADVYHVSCRLRSGL
jgi:hypothetical protein